jgi:hypothetical protein
VTPPQVETVNMVPLATDGAATLLRAPSAAPAPAAPISFRVLRLDNRFTSRSPPFFATARATPERAEFWDIMRSHPNSGQQAWKLRPTSFL